MKTARMVFCTAVVVWLAAVFVWAQCLTDESLAVRMTPQVLNLDSEGSYVKAHVQLLDDSVYSSLAEFEVSLVDSPLQIVCVDGIPLNPPVEMIPGTAKILKGAEVLKVAFYREKLIEQIRDAGVVDKYVDLTVSQGTGIYVGYLSLYTDGAAVTLVEVDVEQLYGITTLNFGPASEGEADWIEAAIIVEGESVYLCGGPVGLPISTDISSAYDDLKEADVSGNVLITLQAFGPGDDEVIFEGVSLVGSGTGGGAGGTGTIKLIVH